MEIIKLSFGGGGSGGAALPLPHTHNSGIVNDGGDLSIPLTNISGSNLNTWILAVS
jgi:hypothetical protein